MKNFWLSVWDSIKLVFSITAIVNNSTNQPNNANQTNIGSPFNTSQINRVNRCMSGYVGDYCELECGLSYFDAHQQQPQEKQYLLPKIVGGQISNAHSWPSAVYISFNYEGYFFLEDVKKYIYVNRSRKFICGGTLIDRTTILTASHCIQTTISLFHNRTEYTFPIGLNKLYPSIASMYKVYLGVHNRSSGFDDETFKMDVRNVIMHEKYNDVTYLNDIALLKLAYPVNLSKKIQIACLPSFKSSSFPYINQESWAVGWGTINFGGPSSELLRMVKLNIYDNHLCRYVSTENPKDWNTQICVGELKGGKDTCQGDSGGPLFVMDYLGNRMRYVQAGITSYGDFCGLANSPGIYTRVSAYLDWIEKHKYN